MESTLEGAEVIHRMKPGRKAKVVEVVQSTDNSASQVLALRIWNGQSPDVSTIERVERIANGLKAQGLPLDITLPHADAGRYLNAHK